MDDIPEYKPTLKTKTILEKLSIVVFLEALDTFRTFRKKILFPSTHSSIEFYSFIVLGGGVLEFLNLSRMSFILKTGSFV